MGRNRKMLFAVPLLVAAAVILSFGGSASAQKFIETERTMYFEGTGQALVWPLWIADGSTDTLFEIVNRLTKFPAQAHADHFGEGIGTGARPARYVLVHFIIHEEKNSEDVRDFNICLSPGDVWTGALTLRPDGKTHLLSSDLSSGPPDDPFSDLGPAPVDVVLLPDSSGANPRRGYIEAVMIDNGTTRDAGCDGDHFSPNPENPALDDDAQFGNAPTDNTFNGINDPLLGREIFVNTANGLATGFNAEAINNFCKPHPERDCGLGATMRGKVTTFRALAMDGHPRAVRGSLLGRFLRDTSKNFDTQVVVTFPGGKNQTFGVCSGDPSSLPSAFGTINDGFGGGAGSSCGANRTLAPGLDFSITAASKLAIWVRNDEECTSISERQIPIPFEVNVITFSSLLDQLFRTTSSFPGGGICKKPENLATSGWFRLLYDANEDEVTDLVSASIVAGPGFFPVASVSVPHIIPAVGFVTITAPTPGARISATFPFQSERPDVFADCFNDSGLSCTNPVTNP